MGSAQVKCAGGCCAGSCAAACCRLMTRRRWRNGSTAAASPSMPRCASRRLTAPDASGCCAIAPGRRSLWTGCTSAIPSSCSTRAPSLARAGLARCCSPRCSSSTASPHSSRRRGSTATATSACWHPTHRCVLRSPRWRRPPRRLHRHHRLRRPPPSRRIVAPPATPGRCCSPACDAGQPRAGGRQARAAGTPAHADHPHPGQQRPRGVPRPPRLPVGTPASTPDTLPQQAPRAVGTPILPQCPMPVARAPLPNERLSRPNRASG